VRILALLAVLAGAQAEQTSSVDAVVSYSAPKGWSVKAFPNSVLLEGDVEAISIQRESLMIRKLKVLGLNGKKGEPMEVAGKKALRFTRSIPRFLAPEHGRALTAAQAKEKMLEHTVFLPLEGQACLIFRIEEKRDRAWPALQAFLKTVSLKSKPR
jgi:hypothetical protein